MDRSDMEPGGGLRNGLAGMTNCYAMRMASRLEAMGQRNYHGTTRRSGGRAVWSGMINLDERTLREHP